MYVTYNNKPELNLGFNETFKGTSDNAFGCFFHPDDVKCYTLDFAVRTIIAYKLEWIDTIYIEDTDGSNGSLEVIDVPDMPGKVTIKCKENKCVFNNNLEMKASTYNKYLTIYIENITFKNARVFLCNLNVHFNNTVFINTNITDRPQFSQVTWMNEIFLTFFQVNFICTIPVCPASGLNFENPNIMIRIDNSYMENINIQIKTLNLFIVIQNSLINLQKSKILFEAESMILAHFNNVTIINQTAHFQTLEVSSKKIEVEMMACIIQNTFGGIQLNKLQSGILESWLRVDIDQSYFINNTKLGSGGALNLLYISSSVISYSYINIKGSSFIGNKVSRQGYKSSYGGALSLNSLPGDLDNGNKVYLIIVECKFENNKAEDGGGAIYTTQYNNYLNITNTIFEVDNEDYVSNETVFIIASSNLSMNSNVFTFKLRKEFVSLLKLEMIEELSEIGSLNITVICLPWHKLSTSSDFKISSITGQLMLKRYTSHCIPCSSSYYLPTDGLYTVRYLRNVSRVQVIDPLLGSSDLQCLDCPYGAECTGSLLKPKPNFWGYKYEGKILFQQCPVGYCCTGTQGISCNSYNVCSANRAGNLCGACKAGYSLSIFSSNCMNDKECKALWFWAVGIISAAAYMLWYTFKDDILSFIGVLLGIICRIKNTKSDTVDKGYFGIMIYFIQAGAMMRLFVPIDTSDNLTTNLQEIEKYIGLMLSIELSYFSSNVCPFKRLTTTHKLMLRFLFLFSIYICLFIMFGLIIIISKIKKRRDNFMPVLKIRFIKGLIEIIKYTYGDITNITFMSLVCVSMATGKVWIYDGTVQCFNTWQVFMIALCVIYSLPFPFTLTLGMNLLEENKISSVNFLCGCFVPLPFLIYWTMLKYVLFNKFTKVDVLECNELEINATSNQSKRSLESTNSMTEETNQGKNTSTKDIIDCFQGTYCKISGGTKYWESVMVLRRLLLGATTLIPENIIQMALCFVLCLIFLIHHVIQRPFLYNSSNKVETLSLITLCLVSVMNLFKSVYIQLGIVPEGPSIGYFKFLRIVESAFVVFLVCYIIVLEIKAKIYTKERKMFKY